MADKTKGAVKKIIITKAEAVQDQGANNESKKKDKITVLDKPSTSKEAKETTDKTEKEEIKTTKVIKDVNSLADLNQKGENNNPVIIVDKGKETLGEKGVTEDSKVLKEDLTDSIVEEKNQLISVKDIVEALSIIVTASRNLRTTDVLDFVTLEHMQFETPQEVTKLDAELSFIGDAKGEWALLWGKQRIIKTLKPETVAEYPNLIKHLHHVLIGTAKEFYRIFRIQTRLNQGTRMIIDPLYIGFSSSLYDLRKEDMRRLVIDNPLFFEYINLGPYDEHRIVLNPALHALHEYTQMLILDAARSNALRLWMERFAERKRYTTSLGGRTIYGKNNTLWYNHARPEFLPRITAQVPNFNLLSVGYAATFCMPECTLSPFDLTQISQTMQVNVNRADPLTEIISAPYDMKNYEDFRRILMALTLPGQVMIDIEMNPHINAYLAGFIALCAKMLFSTTPMARNISMDSAKQMDIYLMAMLEDLGYVHEAQSPPLQVTSRRFPNPALWQDLSTRETVEFFV